MTIIRMSVTNCALGLFLTGAAALVVAPGYAQSQKIVMEEMMVPSSDPDIEIYVRNKHPADMTAFRPDRTVLYVHGATYPASTAFDLQLGGTSWMDYIAARGYDVYLLDLRGYGKSTRPKEMSQPPEANGPIVRGDTAVKDIGSAVEFHSQAPQHRPAQFARMVVGHHANGNLHYAKRQQGRAAGALRTGLDPHHRIAGADRSRADPRLSLGQARSGARTLADRGAGGQEGDAHSRRLVRPVGRRHLGH